MNPLWSKWIQASLSIYFQTAINPLPLFVEGLPRATDALTDWAELRIVGPDYRELTRGNYECTLSVNILILSKMNLTNSYQLITNVGTVQAAFTDISVLEYGNGESYVGCLRLQQAQMPERLRTQLIGKADPSTGLQQAAVEGQFKMDLME